MNDPTRMGDRPRRIAILGGGMAALTAAYELTRHEGWQSRYDITVYQMGWRLGGKTATGRGVHQRIEEHGIHILQGWYDNAFRLLREVYRERRERKISPPSPFADWHEAFIREHGTLLTDYSPEQGRWVSWPVVFPWNDELPGEGPPLSPWALLQKAVAFAAELCLGTPLAPGRGPIARRVLDAFFPPETARAPARPSAPPRRLRRKIDDDWRRRLGAVERRVLRAARRLAEALDGPPSPTALSSILDALRRIVGWFEERARPWLTRDDRIRHAWILVEAAWVGLKGTIVDVYDPVDQRFHFRRIDDLDFRAWLRRHGASDMLLRSAVVRFVYTGTFSNMPTAEAPEGAVAAGTALRFVAKSLGFKGSFVWKFKVGTGDTLVGPLYDVLRARGVRFEFFRRVEAIHPRDRAVDAITVIDQADVPSGDYEPMFELDGLRCWPSEPLWSQLEPTQARALRDGQIDLECPWSAWPGVRTRTLRRGVDFDEVILGIPVAALRTICRGLIDEEPAWRAMVDGVRTVGTHAVQLWLRPTLRELGMDVTAWGMPEGTEPNLVTYANPLYSWIEMTSVLPAERWPEASRPGTVLYLTGWMRDHEPLPQGPDPEFPRHSMARALATTEQWLASQAGWFFPAASTAESPQGLDLSLLVDPRGDAPGGVARLHAQFHRANLDPSSRYTLAYPGTARHRLRADRSGYGNLWLCGDWIDFGMNVGYVEGAITSGAQAAVALRRSLDLHDAEPLFADLEVD